MALLDGVRVELDDLDSTTISLGDPVSGFRSMAEAGGIDGGVLYEWVIEGDFVGGVATKREGGIGVWDETGNTLARNTIWSTESGNAQIEPSAGHLIITPLAASLAAPPSGLEVLNEELDLYYDWPTGNDTTGLGTIGAPYKTPQRCVTHAEGLFFNFNNVKVRPANTGDTSIITASSGVPPVIVRGWHGPGDLHIMGTSGSDIELRGTSCDSCINITEGAELGGVLNIYGWWFSGVSGVDHAVHHTGNGKLILGQPGGFKNTFEERFGHSHIQLNDVFSSMQLCAPFDIVQDAIEADHFLDVDSGRCYIRGDGGNINILGGTLHFATSFVIARFGGYLFTTDDVYTLGGGASVTGVRARSIDGAHIMPDSGSSTHFPGDDPIELARCGTYYDEYAP